MTTISQIVEELQRLSQEDVEAVAGYVQSLTEAQHRRLIAVTEEASAKLMPTLPDPPATGVWKKRSLTDTDDW